MKDKTKELTKEDYENAIPLLPKDKSSNEKEQIKVEFLKDRENYKVGNVVKLDKELAEHLIKKNVVKKVPLEMEVSKSGEKGIPKKHTTLTTLTTDTTLTTLTTDDQLYEVYECSNGVRDTFPETLEKKIILCILEGKNEPITVGKVHEKIGGNKESIRQAIIYGNTKKGIFELKFKKNKENYYRCTTDWIKTQSDIFLTKKAEKEKKVLLEMEVQNKGEKLIGSFKDFFNLMKKESGFYDSKRNTINLDFMKLTEMDLFLSEELENNPKETLEIFESSIEDFGYLNNPRIRVFNLPKGRKISIEQIRNSHLDKLISVCGRVVTLSDVRPQAVSAKFECPSCGTIISVLQLEKKFREPTRCSCGRRGGFRIIDKEMVDTARLILEDLQEKTDNPHAKRMNFFLKDDLLNHKEMGIYDSGTEIEVIGILKEVPIPLSTGGLSTRSDLAIEVSSVSRAEEEISVENMTDEEIQEILSLASKIDEKGLDVLIDSFAPEIYGQQDIKKALCLQLASKKNEIKKGLKVNKPNILLIGDPGSAKSKLGEFAVEITPGARRSVGGSASAVGLTGAVVRDDYTGGWRLEPGAAVLARDFYMIDELNNVKDEDKPRLQELLSEHTITFDKATIHAKLKALSGVLATANPIHGLFKSNEDLVKQFNLSPPIINRFDLIFVIKDLVDEKVDKFIAEKMNQREMGNLSVEYDSEFLKKFFVYIKEQPNPNITKEISEKISRIYVELRKYKTSSLNINPRVHVAFLQLCKSSAKIRLSEKVEEKDITLALNILSKSYFRTPSYDELQRRGNLEKKYFDKQGVLDGE